MEKYGVNESVPQDKLAEVKAGERCPNCKALLADLAQTGVLLCPECGTEPFEKE